MKRWCPESLKWLVGNNRFEEADKILMSIAKMNGREYRAGTLERMITKSVQIEESIEQVTCVKNLFA